MSHSKNIYLGVHSLIFHHKKMSFTKELNDWFGLFLLISDTLESKVSSNSEKWQQLVESKSRKWFITHFTKASKLQTKCYRDIIQLMSYDEFMVWLGELENDSGLTDDEKWIALIRYLDCRKILYEEKKDCDTQETKDLPLVDTHILSFLIDSIKKNKYDWIKAYAYVCDSAKGNPKFMKFIAKYQKWKMPLKDKWFRMFDALQMDIRTLLSLH
jgi:hypothetical protein